MYTPADLAEFDRQRRDMIERQLLARDIRDKRVLAAMARVPRHEFVGPSGESLAYADQPLPIGHGQTISQPYIVALLAQLVASGRRQRVLDVGTGSGYQAAVLSLLFEEVFGLEVVPTLAHAARERLRRLGYDNVTVRHGDGTQGWPEQAPFDAIVVAAAPPSIPPALVNQLAPGGRLVIPVGDFEQRLMLVERSDDGSLHESALIPVAFVPFVTPT